MGSKEFSEMILEAEQKAATYLRENLPKELENKTWYLSLVRCSLISDDELECRYVIPKTDLRVTVYYDFKYDNWIVNSYKVVETQIFKGYDGE